MKIFFAILFLSSLLTSCQPTSTEPAEAPSVAITNAAPESPAARSSAETQSLTLNVPGLSPTAKLSLNGDGSVTLDQWSVRSQGPQVEVLLEGRVFATAKQKRDDWLVERVDGQPLAKLKLRDDGGYKVVSPSDQTLIKVKPKDYGWKVTGPQEEELVKTRVEKGHIKIKSAAGQELNKLDDGGESLACTWLSLESLPLEVRLVLSYLTKGARHASKCQETAGFLISAACSDSAEHKCRQCGKPVCGRHTRSDPNGGQVCIACYRKSGAAYGQSNDDPYLYSGAHHPEYYAYAVAGTAVGVAATAAAMDLAKERKAFRPQEEEDWTDEGWESDYDGS